MTKDSKLDDLDENELSEYLESNSNENLVADETSPSEFADGDNGPNMTIESEEDEEDDIIENSEDDYIQIPVNPDSVVVKEEIPLKAENELKKEQKAEKKEKAKLQKIKQKKIKAHRKYLKKHPTTLVRYETDVKTGLPLEVVEQRILDEQVNESGKKKSKSIAQIFFSNIVSFFNILIFIIAGFLISVGAITDLAFLVIVVVNITIGIVQEIKAKKMIDELSLMSAPYAVVKRAGVIKEIPVNEVVLDDLIILESGKQICADSVVLDGQIEVNESLITGESDAIVKKPGDALFSGSFVVSGKCSARVDKVGKNNYIEKLSNQAKVYKKPKSDLLISLNRIIQVMSIPVIVIGVSLFMIMFLKNGMEWATSIRKTAGAMIGMIPSGLFLMSSIALYVGVIRLGQRNVLVQELYCIEMLARVNCICLDKTGTITDGTMVVKNVIDYNTVYGLATKNVVSAMLNALQDTNMTSQALISKFGLGKRIRHTGAIPFSSQRKYQAVTFDKFGTFVLGAPEFVLGESYKQVSKDVEKYAKLGFRVLCLAHIEGSISGKELPKGPIEVVSMILIEDNIRPDAIETIRYFKESGVQVRVISGDNPITVSKISQRAGVEGAERYISLDGMTDQEVVSAALKYTVFGRVSPSQKKLIIQTLQSAGLTVAMTGDGVNDILALREADCSIALGSGSDAARNVSHLVLLDSNFGSMPSVVAEGRRVINNVTNVASLFLTKTIFSLFLAIQALITGAYPISAVQLILIDVLAIGIPSLILVNEPNNNPVQGKFLPNVIKKALPGALVILTMSLVVFGLSNSLNLDNISYTTIIVIAATHTCLMVLFKACKPFTTIRKVLCTVCYSVFLFAIFVLPQLLEFRPLFSPFEYYSKNYTTEYISKYPKVEISKDNFYVVDGQVISLQVNNNATTTNLTGHLNTTDGKYYYGINGTRIDKELIFPKLSYDNKGHIYAGGYKVDNATFYEGIEKDIKVDENGLLFIERDSQLIPLNITLTKSNSYYNFTIPYGNYKEADAVRQYKILPTVELKDGEYIINGVQSTEYKYQAVNSQYIQGEKLVVKINPETLELLINGKPIYATSNDGEVSKEPYKVSLPKITTSGDRLVKSTTSSGQTVTNDERYQLFFDSVDTGINIFQLYGASESVSKDYPDKKRYTLFKVENIEGEGDVLFRYIYYPDTKEVYKVRNDYINDETKLTLVSDFAIKDFATNDYRSFSYAVVSGSTGDSLVDITVGKPIDVNDVLGNDSLFSSRTNLLSLTLSFTTASTSSYANVYSFSQIVDNDLITKASTLSIDTATIAPTVEVTTSGRYIIDGYYTSYEYTGNELSPRKNNSNYLILGGIVTDYQISSNNIVTMKGGMVTELSINAKIFLLMLCALSIPLMKFFQGLVPWIRKQLQFIQNVISKF
ncbi:MAG: HAD-IC family P-type ATPase [Acholeplasmatales bacterium]|nr:HAD-IC family P-type ATPase [Acholeplasmatales bacterium]